MTTFIKFDPIHTGFLLSTEDAAQLLILLSRSKRIEDEWTREKILIGEPVSVISSTFSSKKYKDITKAQTLGMTYEEYLNAERESKESIQPD